MAMLVLRWYVLLVAFVVCANADEARKNWGNWRGPLGTGVAPDADPPIEWSEEKNVAWKTEIPGLGHSTPAVWGDRIYLTAAVPVGDALKEPKYSGRPGAHNNLPITHKQDFVVIAVDRKDGKILWKKTVKTVLPHEGGHETGSLASNSPVTDGEMVYAFFGSRGLHAFTKDGDPVWNHEFEEMFSKHGHGEGSSPVLYEGILVVNWDHEGKSFIIAFNKRTGEKLWKRERDEGTSWSSPIIVDETHGAPSPLVVVSATKRIRAYDLRTGHVEWECGGLSANVVASPVAENGIFIAGSSYNIRAMVAIDLKKAKGDITEGDAVLWRKTNRTPYVPSPLLYGGIVYYLTHYQGILSKVDAKTGEVKAGPFRLDEMREIYSSPVAAADRVYITDRRGVTIVLDHTGKADELMLSRNVLDDRFNASATIAGKEMFLRGEKFLYCLREE